MFVIGVSGLKGGIGKSTVALNLASALHRDGKRVLIVDVDPQGTCRTWAARAAEADRDGPPVASLEGRTLRRDLGRLSAGFDLVVIDSPPRLGQEARATMMAADVVLLPVIPGGADYWALEESIALVREAQALRPELLAAVVLNRADRTVLARQAAAAVQALDVPVLSARLGHRVTFGEATLAGQGVVDYDDASEAAVEVRRLARMTLDFGASGARAS
jgi:chromosome partitioning protein